MVRWLCIPIFILGLSWSSGAARAQPNPPETYPSGWSMVGGPAGMDFTPASVLIASENGGYVQEQSRIAQTCAGYWAYFGSTATIALPPVSTAVQTCPLAAGWNLVGNPFDVPALLPAGVTAWSWDAAAGAYQLVTSILPGHSVWLYSQAAGNVTLTNAAAVPPAATPVVINALNGFGPYTVHVGDSVEVLMPTAYPASATESGPALKFDSAGVTGQLTCVGDPGCQLMLNNQFWLYHAVSAGIATVTVTPYCALSNPPCASPIETIQVNVLP